MYVLKVGLSPFKKFVLLPSLKALFLLHLKSSFRSQDI